MSLHWREGVGLQCVRRWGCNGGEGGGAAMVCTGREMEEGMGLQWWEGVGLQVGGASGCKGHLFPLCEVSSDDTNSNSQNLTVWSALPEATPLLSGKRATAHTAPW